MPSSENRPALRSVLVVEDEPDIQLVARLALSELAGLDLRICGSGAEALEVVAGFQPQVALLDVMLPDLDGLALWERLRRLPELQALHVVFMTTRIQADELARYQEVGALGVIAKPFDPMTLAATLDDCWNGRFAGLAGGPP